ncbi:MAG: hypothetical protein OER90_17050 [Gemmatimonadota bacterium]|nr:hypothetical protein [Gemmatimonadota bacterium]
MITARYCMRFAVTLCFTVAAAKASQAQTVDLVASAACFETKSLDLQAACEPGVKSIVHYIAAGPSFSRELAEAALDQLERLAVEASDERVRGRALTYIGVAGQPASGTDLIVLARLERIYWASDSHLTRSNAMAFALNHPRSDELANFLGRIAESEPDPEVAEFSLPARAVARLAHLGAPGVQVLQRLSAETVRDPFARSRLAALEARGWAPEQP